MAKLEHSTSRADCQDEAVGSSASTARNLSLDPATFGLVKGIAEREDRSLRAVVRRAVTEYSEGRHDND